MFTKRARSNTDKSHRRECILDATFRLFKQSSFDQISMAHISKEAKLAKGTLYLYFQTKEEVFLALEQREFWRWLSWLDAELTGSGPISLEEFAAQFVTSLRKHPELPRLFSILHTVLEHNLSEKTLLNFKLELTAWMKKLASVLAQRLEGFQEAELAILMTRIYAVMIGLYQFCEPHPVVKKVIHSHDSLEIFRLDFHDELEQTLIDLLRGYRDQAKDKQHKIKSYSFFNNY